MSEVKDPEPELPAAKDPGAEHGRESATKPDDTGLSEPDEEWVEA